VYDRRQAYRTTRARAYSIRTFRKSEDGPIADPVQDDNRRTKVGAVAAAIRPAKVTIGKAMLRLQCIINMVKVRMMVRGDSSCRWRSTVGAPIRTPKMMLCLDPDVIKVILAISRKVVLGVGLKTRTERQSWGNQSEPLSSGPDER
jgi:hypothetical protein